MLVVSGGGTGGHQFPALAIAQGCRERWPDEEVLFVGRDIDHERQAAEKCGLAYLGLNVDPIRRSLSVRNLLALIRLERATRQLQRRMRGRMGTVITTGGYVSGPAAIAARRCAWPLVMHEQNSYPGLVTRTASRWAHTVCTTFESSHKHLPTNRLLLTGLPVRQSASPVFGWNRTVWPLSDFLPHVLIVGGSQGARALVESAGPVLLQITQADPPVCTAVLQTGARNRELIEGPDEQGGLRVRAFIDDMGSELEKADVIICRAGAGTLSEVALWQLPAILVPYPHAAGDHQRHNAEAFASEGAAEIIPESELTAESLHQSLLNLLQDTERRKAMSAAMARLAKPKALDSVLDAIGTAMQDRFESAQEVNE